MTSPHVHIPEPLTSPRLGGARKPALYARPAKEVGHDPIYRVRGLEADLRTLCEGFGAKGGHYVHIGHAVRNLSADHLNRPARFVATSISSRRLYLDEHGLALDPTYRRAIEAKTPFAWSLSEPVWTPEAVSWLGHRLRVRGIQGGVVVPVQDYAAGPAYLCLYFAFADDADQIVADRANALAPMAASFHDCAKAKVRCASSGGVGSLLTPREMDCLRLAALGYTVNETADALQVTPRTVEFHLKNATDKFEASNKLRAVALAVSRGLIAV